AQLMDTRNIHPPDPVAASYQQYFDSGCYDLRYPGPNQATWARVLADLPAGGHVIDYGCGSGRYLLRLHGRAGRAAGYDISPGALDLLRARAGAAGWHDLAILGPDPGDLDRHLAEFGPADLVLCLFGVLGHIETAAARQQALARMRGALKPGTGRLLLSVPNRRRRFGREQSRAGTAAGGLVRYTRRLGAHSVTLPYQLYDPARLKQELAAAGFGHVTLHPESVLPESWLLNHAGLCRLDGMLTPLCPAGLGYGILAVAAP
ncbi:MAG: class I SAM-dependent methyltransferase, partial [Rhodovulum sp.]